MSNRRIRGRVPVEGDDDMAVGAAGAANVLRSPEQPQANIPPPNVARPLQGDGILNPPNPPLVNAPANAANPQDNGLVSLVQRMQEQMQQQQHQHVQQMQMLQQGFMQAMERLSNVTRRDNAMPPVNPNPNNGQGAHANPRNPSTHHLKSSEVKIPTYSGASDAKTPFDYLLEMEKYQSVVSYTERELIELVIPVSLIGDAYNWYRYENEFESWDDFKNRLRREFQAVDYAEDLKRELDNRYQGPNETLTSFIRVILDFYIRLGVEIPEQEQVTKIKRLMHPEYRKALIGIPTNSLNELRAAASQAQEIIKSYRSYKLPPIYGNIEPSLAWKPIPNSPTSSRSYANVAAALPANNRDEHKLHPAAVDPYSYYHKSRSVRFESRSPSPKPTGNYTSPSTSRDSSPSRLCFKCNQPGHFARECKVKPALKTPEMMCTDSEDDTTTVVLANKDKRPFIKIKVLGVEFPAFLDTGSSISVLGDDIISLIKAKGIKCRHAPKKIKFLKGNYVADESVTLTVGYGADSRKHTFHLAPGTITSALLGRDFLGPAMISVHIGNAGWTVGTNPQKVIPFMKCRTPFLSTQNSVNETEETPSAELMSETEYEYPAQVLATWDHLEDESPKPDKRPEVKLFPGSQFEEIQAPASLSESQLNELRDLLEEYKPIFTKLPGLCTAYEHSIDTGDHKPVSTTLRPMTPTKRRIFDESFQELVALDIIEPSYSPWSANAFVVPKKDGTLRPVIDYKPINKITVSDCYPIPRINDQLAILGPCSWFTLFDIAKGYFQIAMKESDKPKTAFLSNHGIWQYKRMPMGLKNSASTFQRCMDKILGPLKWTCCVVYFDDICVFSQTYEDHVVHIQQVLTKLRDAGLTIHPGKIQLCKNRLKYLGFIIEPGKCIPDPEKVRCLREYPRPKSPKDIQRFLGFVGFYMRFIPHFSKHSRPLTQLIKKGVRFVWNEQAERGFCALKYSLSEYSMLYLPDMKREFIIQSDASDFSYGFILIQEIDGIRHPVWFGSKQFTEAEIRYSTVQKEIRAAITAIETFSPFIEYSHFILETDHQAISWLNKLKHPTGRLGRWFLKLQMYDFDVHYRKGSSKVMKGPDALSRISHSFMIVDNDTSLTRSELINLQDTDPFLSSIKTYLISKNDSTSTIIKDEAQKCSLTDDNLLMRYVGCKSKPWEDDCLYWRIYIPEAMRDKVIFMFLNTSLSCHMGIRKNYSRLDQRVYWKGMRNSVQKYIQHCKICQESKAFRIPPAPASGFKCNAPFDLITIDLMGPYTKGRHQSTHLLVCVDYFTRYVELFPLRQTKSEVIISKLWELCCRWGLPKVILSDNATNFTSKLYTDWCVSLGIKPFYISAYHPQANMTERYNQSVKNMIICMSKECKDWDLYINEIAFALRSSPNDSTGMSPAYANFGRELRTPFDNLAQVELAKFKEVQDISKRLVTVHNVLLEQNHDSQVKYLKKLNESSKARCFKTGDLVWLRSHFLSDASRGITASLTKKREGPYKVSSVISQNIYNLEHSETGGKVYKVHINELSPYFCPLTEYGETNTFPESKQSEKKLDDAAATAALLPFYDATNDGTNGSVMDSETEEAAIPEGFGAYPETDCKVPGWGYSEEE